MKTLLILSGILCVPFFFLSLAITTILLLDIHHFGLEINGVALLIIASILGISTTIIMTTCFRMCSYTSKINKLEKAEEEAFEEQKKAQRIISKFTFLIQSEKNN